MKLMRKAGLSAVLLLTLLWFSCGDVFRPVATPILKPGGDPALFKYAIVVNNNNGGFGTTTQVDVSGDTNIGNFPVGKGPVFAILNPFQTQAFTADRDGDSISYYSPTSGAGTPASTILLPAGSKPVFLAIRNLLKLYVANSGTNSVGVISLMNNALVDSVPVGPNPVALVETTDAGKVYCVNKGNSTVTVISTADDAIINPGISVGASPVWAVLKPDNSVLYVANQGGNSISVISTTTNSVIGTLQLPAGANPNYLFYDSHLQRLYVTNPGTHSVSVFDTSSSGLPTELATVDMGAGNTPVSVTALADGSRVYVANERALANGTPTNGIVSVIDAVSLTLKGNPITVGVTPISIASAPDSSRVFVANRDSNTVSSIATANDTIMATINTGSAAPVYVTVSQ